MTTIKVSKDRTIVLLVTHFHIKNDFFSKYYKHMERIATAFDDTPIEIIIDTDNEVKLKVIGLLPNKGGLKYANEKYRALEELVAVWRKDHKFTMMTYEFELRAQSWKV